jgi:hypothetical protein
VSTSRVNVFNFFPELTAEIERRTIRALEAAAEAGRAVANVEQGNLRRQFEVVQVRPTGAGFAAGIKGSPLVRIFDKGSLGKHVGALKSTRKPSWQVNRGSNPYLAERHDDLSGKGVTARRIINPARLAGRKALVAGIRGR